MSATILVLNAGSSSVKFQLFEAAGEPVPQCRLKGSIEGIGTSHPRFVVEGLCGSRDDVGDQVPLASVPLAIEAMRPRRRP